MDSAIHFCGDRPGGGASRCGIQLLLQIISAVEDGKRARGKRSRGEKPIDVTMAIELSTASARPERQPVVRVHSPSDAAPQPSALNTPSPIRPVVNTAPTVRSDFIRRWLPKSSPLACCPTFTYRLLSASSIRPPLLRSRSQFPFPFPFPFPPSTSPSPSSPVL